MPTIPRSSRADYDTTNAIRSPIIADLKAAAAIPGACVPCTISSLGVRPASGYDPLHGWSSRDALPGEPVTLFLFMRAHYADGGLVPGERIYREANTYELSTDPLGDPVGFAVTETDVMLYGVLGPAAVGEAF
ncbi:hypothetical protein [Deinococcus sp. YIM 77859]|uniref:hypothetical protein n=1 Tax=Deinococcus sp. YIM 77859 TaxID=1540221 RepID=UPI000550850E|nr:hypothetical protein [Deinococcus sp. YIM 77859]